MSIYDTLNEQQKDAETAHRRTGADSGGSPVLEKQEC